MDQSAPGGSGLEPVTALLDGPAGAIADAVNGRRVSARMVAEAALARIATANPVVNAFTDVTAARALSEADTVDAAIAQGRTLPLAGVPYSVKNLFDIEGVTTRAGSRINRDHPPATADGPLVSRAKAAGAILTGAVNMGEYAYDFTGENVHDGNARNPHDLDRMSGGSSGGSGTAVAAGLSSFSLGSDTNGSIRVPSSFCGLFGLKPTFGRLSRSGTFPFTPSLDHLGPFARSARDLALIFDLLQGWDDGDTSLARRPAIATRDTLDLGVGDLRIARAGGYFTERLGPDAEAAMKIVADALSVDRVVDVPEAHRARAAAYVITTAESATVHLDRLRKRAGDFDPATRDRFLSGAMVPTPWYVAAHRFRSWFKASMARIFESVDALIAPATPFPALRSGTATITLGGVDLPARPNIGIFTQPISFVGLPVAAVPVWPQGDEGLPIAVQVIAPAWREDIALRIAHSLQETGVARAPVARQFRGKT